MWVNLTWPWDFPAETIYYRRSDLAVPEDASDVFKAVLQCIRRLYMCWAHFICSYISQEESSVRLMGSVHSDRVTCRDKWAHEDRRRRRMISISKQIHTFSLFISPPTWSPLAIQWTLDDSGVSLLTCRDWLTCILKTENGHNFSHQVMGRRDQYSHCWLSFRNL